MTQIATTTFDQQRADAFAERLLDMTNQAAITLMLSIGHRTGLFDRLATLPPSSSADIADVAGLHERYVREWLGAMTVAGIVDYNEQMATYSLPAEHAAWLTRAASPNNLAQSMQWFSVLGHIEDRIVECFRNGGGITYEECHRFHEVMADESAQTVVAGLLDHVIGFVPGLWQRLEAGIDALDIGCGAGRALLLLAETFPNSRFTGYDLCADAIATARAAARRKGLTNITFAVRDVARLEDVAAYDLVTGFDVIHDQARPDQVLDCVYAALRPGGTYLMQDIAASSHLENNRAHPLGPFLYTISTMHCMSVSLGQGGAGLGTVWGEELALKMLADAGFEDVTVRRLEHDIQNNYYIAPKR